MPQPLSDGRRAVRLQRVKPAGLRGGEAYSDKPAPHVFPFIDNGGKLRSDSHQPLHGRCGVRTRPRSKWAGCSQTLRARKVCRGAGTGRHTTVATRPRLRWVSCGVLRRASATSVAPSASSMLMLPRAAGHAAQGVPATSEIACCRRLSMLPRKTGGGSYHQDAMQRHRPLTFIVTRKSPDSGLTLYLGRRETPHRRATKGF